MSHMSSSVNCSPFDWSLLEEGSNYISIVHKHDKSHVVWGLVVLSDVKSPCWFAIDRVWLSGLWAWGGVGPALLQFLFRIQHLNPTLILNPEP